MTGKVLGNYEILDKLGEGGTGEVGRPLRSAFGCHHVTVQPDLYVALGLN